jgi:hypothetical protein
LLLAARLNAYNFRPSALKNKQRGMDITMKIKGYHDRSGMDITMKTAGEVAVQNCLRQA